MLFVGMCNSQTVSQWGRFFYFYATLPGMVNKKPFSDETIAALKELGEVLRGIHNRMISEGWIIKGGVFTPPPGYQPPKQSRKWTRRSE